MKQLRDFLCPDPFKIASWQDINAHCYIGDSNNCTAVQVLMPSILYLNFMILSRIILYFQRGKKCVRTVKAQRKVRYSFSNCHSKFFTPKYCGACNDGRCCTPKSTSTKAIRFTCDDGFRFKKRMMVIKSCDCSRKCPGTNNDLFSSYKRLGGDTWRNWKVGSFSKWNGFTFSSEDMEKHY